MYIFYYLIINQFSLQDWNRKNGKIYGKYSTAKAAFQASLKKSVYLVSESSSIKELRFRFANEVEIRGIIFHFLCKCIFAF